MTTPEDVINKRITNAELESALKVVENFLSERAVTLTEAQNFEGSHLRVARMYKEMAWHPRVIAQEVSSILKVSFPVDVSVEAGMVAQGPIVLNSMCPHHFLPVRYSAFVAYLPKEGGKVLGLSKLSRIPEFLSKRFVLQEQLAKDIADALYDPSSMALFRGNEEAFDFKSAGSIVSLIGHHTCMSCRGAQQDARTSVTERRGAFQEPGMESRFNQTMQALRLERPFGG